MARRLLKETYMRTTTSSALFATLLAVGCAPIGEGANRATRVDAGGSGSADLSCDDIVTKTMDLDFSTSTTLSTLPTGCWKLDGKLTIDSSVTTLASLGDLRGVSQLVMTGSQLTSLDTPSPLAVSDSIDIENNAKLTDLNNLSVSTDDSCGAYVSTVTVTGNSELTGLGGLNQLRCVSGAATFQNNIAMTTLDLSYAKRLEGGLTIQDNTALTSLKLNQLTSVTEGITIKNNAALTSLGSWAQLQFVHGSLMIDTNAAITTLEGTLPTASIMIEGALTITNNAKLTEVGEFDHLAGAETISVSTNAALDYCEAREIGCCVPHGTETALIQGNKNTQCNGPSSWCFQPNGNQCDGNYTGYNP
jgi:hypothetical protein